MKLSTVSFLLVVGVASSIAAPVPDAHVEIPELERRLFGIGSKPALAPAKPPPVIVKPSIAPVKATTKAAAPVTTLASATATPVTTKVATSISESQSLATTLSKLTSASSATTQTTSSTSSSASCAPLPSSTVKAPKPSLLDDIKGIFKRDDAEFIGWHGTNSKTADLWTSAGSIVKPVNDDGSVAGTSGLDAELGPGLYISDTLSVAEAASAINAKNNNLGAKACAIFAKSSDNWRNTVIKAQIPETIRGNGAQFELMRQTYLKHLPRPGNVNSIKIGPLTSTTNQLVIPESLNPSLSAQCFDVVNLDAQNVPASIPTINYNSDDITASWLVIKQDLNLATAVKAAITKGCST